MKWKYILWSQRMYVSVCVCVCLCVGVWGTKAGLTFVVHLLCSSHLFSHLFLLKL